MKKLIIAVSTLGLSAVINAQTTEAPAAAPAASADLHHVEIGFRFMPTVSDFKMQNAGGGAVQGQATFGYGIGGMFALNFTNHVGVQGEIIYNALSQKYKDPNMDGTIHIDYVNIPLLLSLNTGKSSAVNLNFVAGPEVGYNVGSRIVSSGSSESDTLQATIVTKKGNWGFCYGAGLQFALNQERTMRLDLGFRGVFGFVDIQEQSSSPNTRTYNVIAKTNIQTYSGFAGLAFLF